MTQLEYDLYYGGYLAHHGIKGMKWGIRKYQNPDGTLTAEGRRRYGKSIERGRQLVSQGKSRSGVVKGALGRQALMTGVLAGKQYLGNKYKDAINSKYFKSINLANNKIANNLLDGISNNDLKRYEFIKNPMANYNRTFLMKFGGNAIRSKMSPDKMKNIERYTKVNNVATNLKGNIINDTRNNRVTRDYTNLNLLGYGVGTAANLAKSARDYRDIRNYEIANGLDKKRKKK